MLGGCTEHKPQLTVGQAALSVKPSAQLSGTLLGAWQCTSNHSLRTMKCSYIGWRGLQPDQPRYEALNVQEPGLLWLCLIAQTHKGVIDTAPYADQRTRFVASWARHLLPCTSFVASRALPWDQKLKRSDQQVRRMPSCMHLTWSSELGAADARIARQPRRPCMRGQSSCSCECLARWQRTLGYDTARVPAVLCCTYFWALSLGGILSSTATRCTMPVQ